MRGVPSVISFVMSAAIAIASRKRRYSEQRFQQLRNTGVIVDPMVHQVSWNQRGSDYTRDTRSILLKCKSIAVVRRVGRGISGRNCSRRNSVIEEPSVFVPGHDQNAVVPHR